MAIAHSAPAAAATARFDDRRAVRFWLIAVAGLVFLMVLVGGATRLTESGLSITQWKPVTGVIPPLSGAEWQAEFDRYKQIPQFAELNSDMTLDGFKSIFWWEWGHRLLARVVGAAFILPGLWFWWKGQLKGALGRGVAVATGLLALEPIVGWWMVTSGLSERTEVAQQRLALHLLIAAATFGALIYAAVSLSERPKAKSAPRGFAIAAWIFAALIFCQLGLGALVAGLRAGLIYNTWPLMGSSFVPGEAFHPSAVAAIFGDPATAQFDHRMLAYAVVVFAILQAIAALRGAPGSALASRAVVLAAVALIQVGLGIATLLAVVPIALALPHQALALALFGLSVVHVRATGMERGPSAGGSSVVAESPTARLPSSSPLQ
ncbi:MAG TPA: COX15/CtaA family protein [Roseiarcus sp.]|nr:COX15/CtaA family protein [Roseiarcus sp.]